MAVTPLKRKVREAAKSSAREGILRAAEAAFVAEGNVGVSMQAIAAKAGTSVGTLYNYFDDRDDLVRELFDDRKRHLGESVDAAVAAAAAFPFEVQLRALVQTVLAHFDEHRAFLALILSTDSTAALKKRNAGALLRDRVRAVVQKGVDEGVVDIAVAPLAATALSGTLRAVLIEGVDEPGTFVSHVDAVVRLFLEGAMARRRLA